MKLVSDYTLRKEFPLTDEQNEIIDFMIRRTKCVCAAQTGFRLKNLHGVHCTLSFINKIPRYSCYNISSTKSSKSV